jgi:beta-1,2-mannobiose phosphorylase / 1,2-beta-oligomannan phosphorylase
MIKISKGKIVLESRTYLEFENEGVLNPTCVEKDGIVHMFYRATSKGKISTIGYCQIKNDKVIFRADKPILVPEYRYEKQGLEDPRITFLDGKYYMLYTAYDGQNAVIAYAVSNDLKQWVKKGLMSPQMTYDEAEDIFQNSGVKQRYTFFEKLFRYERSDKVKLWEKDAMLFPKKINGKYALIHRILPGIQICYFEDFDDLTVSFWKNYLKNLNNHVILNPKFDFEKAYIGAGCVPIETDDGWLMIYHGVKIDDGVKTYSVSAALLDKYNPQKVIGRLNYPLFYPKEKWEIEGIVNNVVFPTGTYVKNDDLFIYYGAADDVIGVRKLSISNLLEELLDENKKAN